MSKKTKRIAFIDDNADNFHAMIYLKHLREGLKKRGYDVAGVSALKREPSKAWAEKNDVPYFDSVAELDAQCDAYMILAPSTPRTHLKLCQTVFPFGKTTYVDKTFAPDLATAEKIFALADKHGVKMQTTSALRYTEVQDFATEVGRKDLKHMVTWGGGRSFGEYAIHPTEMLVSCMGPNAKRLRRRGTGKFSQLLINFSGGRTGVVNVSVGTQTGFSASVATITETRHIPVTQDIFLNMAGAILDLFDSGRPSIDRKESLMIRRILDVAADKRALKGFVAL